jgi:hypothetical protein
MLRITSLLTALVMAISCMQVSQAAESKAKSEKPAAQMTDSSADASGTISGRIIVNVNKTLIPAINLGPKYHAEPGIPVFLFVDTPEFRKWLKAISKKNSTPSPPPAEVLATMKVTQVGDKSGFQFSGIAPGKYCIVSDVSYVTDRARTEVVGQTDRYVNGAYAGTYDNYGPVWYQSQEGRRLKEFVEIKEPGDTVKITLRQ